MKIPLILAVCVFVASCAPVSSTPETEEVALTPTVTPIQHAFTQPADGTVGAPMATGMAGAALSPAMTTGVQQTVPAGMTQQQLSLLPTLTPTQQALLMAGQTPATGAATMTGAPAASQVAPAALPVAEAPKVEAAPKVAAVPQAKVRYGVILDEKAEYPFARCGFAKGFMGEGWFSDVGTATFDLRNAFGYEKEPLGADIAGKAQGMLSLGDEGALREICVSTDAKRAVLLLRAQEGDRGWAILKYDYENKVVSPAILLGMRPPDYYLPQPLSFGKRQGGNIPLEAVREDGTRVRYEYSFAENVLRIQQICTRAGGDAPTCTTY